MERIEVLQRLEGEVGILLRRSRRVLAARARLVHPDLTVPAYLMLAHLGMCGPRRASEIAEAFELDKGAVSRAVQSMLELGLITKEPDPEDGRAVILNATQESRAALTRIATRRLEDLDQTLGDWSMADLESFVDSFSRYNGMVEGSAVAD